MSCPNGLAISTGESWEEVDHVEFSVRVPVLSRIAAVTREWL
jgi:hypothetical protein